MLKHAIAIAFHSRCEVCTHMLQDLMVGLLGMMHPEQLSMELEVNSTIWVGFWTLVERYVSMICHSPIVCTIPTHIIEVFM